MQSWIFAEIGHACCSPVRPEVAGENIPCYKRRSCRVALLMLVALVMLSCCLAFPVILTALAISRLFGAKSNRCPFYMHLAICNWERLHRGSAGPLPELPISEGNLLWVDPNISASQDAMSEAVDALRHANVQKLHHDLCNFLEAWLPKLGFNGIVELLEGLEMIRDGEAEDDQDLDVWGINLDDIHAELVDISEDWKHDLGAYVIARLKLHPELTLGGASTLHPSSHIANIILFSYCHTSLFRILILDGFYSSWSGYRV